MKARIPILLFGLLLINLSCVVYQKTSVPLSEAYDKGKVKVKTKSGEVLKFHHIKFENGRYYGLVRDEVTNERGHLKLVKYYIPITDEQAAGVYPKDKKKSRNRTILLATSPVMVASAMFIATLLMIAIFGI